MTVELRGATVDDAERIVRFWRDAGASTPRWRALRGLGGRGAGGLSVFLAHRPSEDEIGRFLDASRALPLSYEPAGLGRTGAALTTWRHFDLRAVRRAAEEAP